MNPFVPVLIGAASGGVIGAIVIWFAAPAVLRREMTRAGYRVLRDATREDEAPDEW